MKHRIRLLTMSLGLIGLLSGCIPGVGGLIESPRFSLAPNGAQLVRLDPPGVGPAAALFRFNIDVENPNSFGLNLAGIDFDFFVEGNQVARSQFRDGVQLAANGRSQLTLDASVPLREGIQLLVDLAELIIGEPTDYRIDGTVSVRALGSVQRLPELTIVSGTLTQPIRLAPPQVRLASGRTGVREISTQRVVVGVGLELRNPTPVGFLFRAPDLTLTLGNATIGRAGLVEQPVPALSTSSLDLTFEFSPFRFASQAATLTSGGSLNLGLGGDFALVVPGITTSNFPTQQLVSGLLR